MNRLCTVTYDRCEDGLNWHVMAPSGHLMDSYRDKGEADMVADDRNLDELRAMEDEAYAAQAESQTEHVTEDIAASARRWEMRRSPVTKSRWS
jgi:hypothetical protein